MWRIEEIRHSGGVEVIEWIDFIEMMREFGRLVILRIENPYNLLWRIGEIRHIGYFCSTWGCLFPSFCQPKYKSQRLILFVLSFPYKRITIFYNNK